MQIIWTALDAGDDYLSTNQQAVLCHTPENQRQRLDIWKCAVRGFDENIKKNTVTII